ncbi:MAG: response regulator, partial [Deltaproteobacteria bacterium]
MEFSQEDIREFCQEATELLEAAEESLLALDKGGPFQTHYDAIFRAFHSTKGGAGMMELTRLQAHMHQLENQLVQCKALQKIPKPQIDLFLRGIDAAREIMAGREVKFDYNPSAEAPREASPSKSTPTEVVGLKTEAQVIPIEKNKKNNGDSLGTVLVIDDEKDIVELISQILIDNGFEVFGFTNPNDALSYLNNHPVDLIFTDYKMPQMTGFDLANVIGKKFPELPIVVVSGHTKGSVVVAGIYAIIEK